MAKNHMTQFSDADYLRHVREYGDDYLGKTPRPIAR
jgi:hypothetical protein